MLIINYKSMERNGSSLLHWYYFYFSADDLNIKQYDQAVISIYQLGMLQNNTVLIPNSIH